MIGKVKSTASIALIAAVNSILLLVVDDSHPDDDLVFSQHKNTYEVDKIMGETNVTNNSIILDVGSGTGHHVNEFTKKGATCEGLDNSQAMVRYAKNKFHSATFKHVTLLRQCYIIKRHLHT